MKTSLNISVVFVLISMIHVFQVNVNASACGSDLTDKLGSFVCLSMIGGCQTNLMTKFVWCRKTCSSITSVQQSKTGGCQTDCKDNILTATCQLLKQRKCCDTFYNSCPLTCNRCTPCAAPPPPCSYDCEDTGEFCSHWKKQKYCDPKSEHYDFMTHKCPQTCEICKACPTPSPKNTALPPTLIPPESPCLTSGCEDENPSCNHWAQSGFCNSTGAYPHTLEVCPKSCNVCVPCARSQQPVASIKPKCSEDCVDSNAECGFWRTQGLCNSTSEHYSLMKQLCRATCNFCNPCNNQTSQITTEVVTTSPMKVSWRGEAQSVP